MSRMRKWFGVVVLGSAVAGTTSGLEPETLPTKADDSTISKANESLKKVADVESFSPDPGFGRLVDLQACGEAWDSSDATRLADSALQWIAAERTLKRSFEALPAVELFRAALATATKASDAQTLDRLSSAARAGGRPELIALLEEIGKVDAQERSFAPFAVSVDDVTPEEFARLKAAIEDCTRCDGPACADAASSTSAIAKRWGLSEDLAERARLLFERRKGTIDLVGPEVTVKLDRLALASRAHAEPAPSPSPDPPADPPVSVTGVFAESRAYEGPDHFGGSDSASGEQDSREPENDLSAIERAWRPPDAGSHGLATVHDDLRDRPFERWIEPSVLARAWETLDPVLMTDVALRLAEGERVLFRSHERIKAEEAIRLSARLAAEKNDAASLERLASGIDDRAELAQTLETARMLAASSREASPLQTAPIAETSVGEFKRLRESALAILRAKVAGDSRYLPPGLEEIDGEASDARPEGESDLARMRREYIERVSGSVRSQGDDGRPVSPDTLDYLDKLLEAVRSDTEEIPRGRGSGGGGIRG